MYVFNHIPKTGGVSIYQLLHDLLGSAQVSPHISFHEDIPYQVSANDFAHYFIIYGHIGIVWNDIVGPGRRGMTMLRDPVDRVLSQYYFWRNMVPPSPHLPHVHAAQTLSLKDFVYSREPLVLQGNQDVQTWFLADDFRRQYRRIKPNDALEIAQQNLSERFDFVGLFEDYPGSVERLCRLLGISPPAFIPMENRTVGRLSIGEHDPAVVDAIRELNGLDQELYHYGKQLV